MLRSELGRALAEFYASGLENENLVERTFALTSQVLPFDLNSHGVIDAATGMLSAHFDAAMPGLDDAFAAFGRHMGKYPAFRFDPRFADGKPYSARDIYSQTAFEDLDIFQEVYRPMRFTDHCFVHVPARTGTVFVGFLRDGRPFDPEEKALLGELQPHLANGRALAEAVSTAKTMEISPELFVRAGFTARESEALYWLTQGKRTGEIATTFGVRQDTVRRLLQNAYEKLGVKHRTAATIRATALARTLHAEECRANGVLLHVPTR